MEVNSSKKSWVLEAHELSLSCTASVTTSHHTNMQSCWILLLSHYLQLLTWINAIELPFVSFKLTRNLKPAASFSCGIAPPPPTLDATRRMNLRVKSWFWKAFLGFWFLVAHYVSSFTHYFSSVSFFLSFLNKNLDLSPKKRRKIE